MEGAVWLQPCVILLFPRFTEAVATIVEIIVPSAVNCWAVALSGSSEESRQFAAQWPESLSLPLLILRGRAEDQQALATSAVLHIAGQHPTQPVGVLIADGPDVEDYRAGD
jgi:hypothetical protein